MLQLDITRDEPTTQITTGGITVSSRFDNMTACGNLATMYGEKKTTSNRRCQKITVRDDNIQSAHYELPAYIMIMPMCGTGVVLARLTKSTHVCGLPNDGLLGRWQVASVGLQEGRSA